MRVLCKIIQKSYKFYNIFFTQNFNFYLTAEYNVIIIFFVESSKEASIVSKNNRIFFYHYFEYNKGQKKVD